MRSDAEILTEGMKALIDRLDELDVGRFITLIKRDKTDYTKWRENLWEGKTLKEIHEMATEYANRNRKKVGVE